jgi:hypothetical protein
MKGRAWTLFTSNDAAALLAYNFVLRQLFGEVDRHLLKSSLMYIEIERSWLRGRGWRCFRVLNKNMVLTFFTSCLHSHVVAWDILGVLRPQKYQIRSYTWLLRIMIYLIRRTEHFNWAKSEAVVFSKMIIIDICFALLSVYPFLSSFLYAQRNLLFKALAL